MINHFYEKAQKGFGYLGRFYRKDIDGEWEEDESLHYHRKKNDEKYVKTRLNAALMKAAKSRDMSFDKIDVDDNLYLIVVCVKEATKKYDAFLSEGFAKLNGVI